MSRKKSYGLFSLILDMALICLTGGLWFIWIIVRYLRSNTNR